MLLCSPPISCAFEIHINPPVMVHITFDFKDRVSNYIFGHGVRALHLN